MNVMVGLYDDQATFFFRLFVRAIVARRYRDLSGFNSAIGRQYHLVSVVTLALVVRGDQPLSVNDGAPARLFKKLLQPTRRQ